MKLVIEVDTEKLPQDMSVRTRYFSKILHDKVVDALSRVNLTVGEFDGSLIGKPILDENGLKIGRIGFE